MNQSRQNSPVCFLVKTDTGSQGLTAMDVQEVLAEALEYRRERVEVEMVDGQQKAAVPGKAVEAVARVIFEARYSELAWWHLSKTTKQALCERTRPAVEAALPHLRSEWEETREQILDVVGELEARTGSSGTPGEEWRDGADTAKCRELATRLRAALSTTGGEKS
jgi:hypothetical protein